MKKIVLAALALMLIIATVCSCESNETTSSLAESSQEEVVSSKAPTSQANTSSANSLVAAKTVVTVQDLYGKPGDDTDYITFVDSTYTGVLPEYILFTTSATVTEFKFFDITRDADGKAIPGEPLYTLSELVEENGLCICTYINDVIRNKGVSFTEENGTERFFEIAKDFDKNRLLLIEIEA